MVFGDGRRRRRRAGDGRSVMGPCVRTAAAVVAVFFVLYCALLTGPGVVDGFERGSGKIACKPHPIDNIANCHIMKTGGSTLHTVLARHALQNPNTKVLSVHGPIKDSKWFRLAMFREPVARVISHYWQVKPTPLHPGGADFACRDAASRSFNAFLNQCRFAHDLQTQQVADTFGGKARGSPADKVEVLRKYDLVLLTEHFHQALVLLHLRVGISLETLLYWRMKDRSTRTKTALELTSELKSRVLERNRNDLALWEAAHVVYNETLSRIDCDVHVAVKNYEALLRRWLEACGTNIYHGDGHCVVQLHSKCGEWKERIVSYDKCRKEFCASDPVCKANDLFATLTS